MFRYLAGFAGIVLAVLLIAPIEAQATPNLLLNPSFEILTPGGLNNSCGTGCTYSAEGNAYSNCCSTDSTTIPDWTISAFTQAAGEEIPGGTALEPVPDGVADAFTSGGSIYQTVAATVVAGDTYYLSAWIANYSGGTYNMFVQSAYTYGSTSALFGTSATGLTDGIWTQVAGSWTAGAGDAGDPLTVILFNQGGAGQAQFDDVCFTIGTGCTVASSDPAGVPEPITLSIFGAGLAGVAAFRRRKAKSA